VIRNESLKLSRRKRKEKFILRRCFWEKVKEIFNEDFINVVLYSGRQFGKKLGQFIPNGTQQK
jgi:hypothetical protein